MVLFEIGISYLNPCLKSNNILYSYYRTHYFYQAYISPGPKSAHKCTRMCASMCSQACMCSKKCMCAHMCASICSKTYMYAHMCTCMGTHMCSQTCMCAHMCIRMCSQTCMCTIFILYFFTSKRGPLLYSNLLSIRPWFI